MFKNMHDFFFTTNKRHLDINCSRLITPDPTNTSMARLQSRGHNLANNIRRLSAGDRWRVWGELGNVLNWLLLAEAV
jgi:hypothetical protein